MATVRLSVSIKAVTLGLAAAVAVIVTGSFVLQVLGAMYGYDHIYGLLPFLHIDREGNMPSWLSSAMLASCAAVAWSLGTSGTANRPEPASGWRLGAVFLLYMSIDEGAQVHERAGAFIQPWLPDISLFYFGWVAIALVVLLALLPFFIRFITQLDKRMRTYMVIATVVFLSGALGVEIATGIYMGDTDNKMTFGYLVLSHIEESLEMVGTIILLRGLLDYVERTDRVTRETDMAVAG